MAGTQTSTTLTPDMARLGTTGGSASSRPTAGTLFFVNRNHEYIYSISNVVSVQQMFGTAIFYAEQLCRMPTANISDHILFSKCFQLSGEHRRCLVTLEHRGLLSVDIIGPLSDALKIDESSTSKKNSKENKMFFTPVQLSQLAAVFLAASCLFHLEEYEDCITFLESFIAVEDNDDGSAVSRHIKNIIPNQLHSIHVMSGIYSLAGKCFDVLENRARATRAFTIALRIDPACTEVAEYIASRGLLSREERKNLLKSAIDLNGGNEYLAPYYNLLLDDGNPEEWERADAKNIVTETALSVPPTSPISLIRRAEYLYNRHMHEEAYHLARQAYTIDPYDWRGNLVYIAAMVNLKLKNELFYLGHELVNTHPKQAISWYTVGCYYWTCGKYEQSQKHLQKATKIDKRLSHAWILLGHVLAAQEESEHAISAYRTACRILPGDHHPKIFMAKELVRTSNYSLALHVLTEALELCPSDPSILNELGAVYMNLNRAQEALNPLRKAAESILQIGGRDSKRRNTTGAIEVLSNYATCLRTCGMLENALEWYYQCLAYEPMDAETHANIGYTLHLSKRFDEAVEQYHRALSLRPSFSLCVDLLSQVLEDMSLYKSLQRPERPSAAKYLAELFPPEQRDKEIEHISAATVPLDISIGGNSSTSFHIHHDSGGKKDRSYSGVFVGDGISGIGEAFSQSSVRRRGGDITGMSLESAGDFEESEYSVESYSRIAGRLSLDSTMS